MMISNTKYCRTYILYCTLVGSKRCRYYKHIYFYQLSAENTVSYKPFRQLLLPVFFVCGRAFFPFSVRTSQYFFVQKNNISIFVTLAENAAETDPLATHIKNSDIYLSLLRCTNIIWGISTNNNICMYHLLNLITILYVFAKGHNFDKRAKI